MGGRKLVLLAGVILVLSAGGPLLDPGEDVRGDAPGKVTERAESPAVIPGPELMLDGLLGFFVENRGQVASEGVRFYAEGARMSVGLTSMGAIFTTLGPTSDEWQEPASGLGSPRVGRYAFSMSFEGCNDVEPRGFNQLQMSTSHFLGSDASRWVSSARSFSEVLYQGIYDGIDLRFYFRDGELKYDYLVGAGADTSAILHRYDGVRGLEVDRATGDLLARTPLGTFRDTRPVVLQDGADGDQGLPASFKVVDGSRCAFALPDGVRRDLPFVIDPGLIFSTYFGGRDDDVPFAMVIDDHDDIYLAGLTNSLDFPTTPGCLDRVGNATTGFYDGFVAKFTSDGWPMHVTFIGGLDEDVVTSIALEADGDVLALGETRSTDFPRTGSGTHHGATDLFVVRLNGDCSRLLFSELYGGSGDDSSLEMDIGADGRIYACAMTSSPDVATTAGAYCRTYEGGSVHPYAGLVLVLSLAMDVRYCSYLNGLAPHVSDPETTLDMIVISQALDGSGRLYLTGSTASSAFPTTAGAYSRALRGGQCDAFVMLLDPMGAGASDLVASTLLGGDGYDVPMDIELDEEGNVYLTGHTTSSDLPMTPDALIRSKRCVQSGFVASLDGGLGSLRYGSYYSGEGGEWFDDIEVGPAHGMVTIHGETVSELIPTTPGCFDPMYRGTIVGEYHPGNHYIAVLDLEGARVDYATYFGGTRASGSAVGDEVLGIDGNGDIVLAAFVLSDDYATTEGAYCRIGMGQYDMVLLKLNPTACGLPTPPEATGRAGDRCANVSWRPHTMVGYRVLEYRVYDLTNPGAPVLLRTVSGEINGTLIEGLENGRVYTLGVSALNSMGEGPTGNVTVRPVGTSTEPTALVATTGDGRVHLSWGRPLDEGGGILGYTVSRGPYMDELEPINTTTALAFTDATVATGGFYLYSVVAFNEAGNGTGAYVTVRVQSPPAPPTGLRAEPGDGFVRLTWIPPTSNGGASINAYRVYRGISAEAIDFYKEIGREVLEVRDKGLLNGMTYHYRISALNIHGESDLGPVVNATPFGPPGPPRGLEAHAGDASVKLSWYPPSDENGRPVTGYRIYLGESIQSLSHAGSTNLTEATLSGLKNGRLHYFQVTAVNAWGAGPIWSEVAEATPFGRPSQVNAFSIMCEANGIMVRWLPPTEAGGTDQLAYVVLRGGSPDALAVLARVTTSLEWLDTNVTVGATYHYSVRAVNPLWDGEDLAPMQVRYVRAPGAVTDLRASAGDFQVRLTWSPAEDDGGIPFMLYTIVKRTPEGDVLEINETDLLEYTDTTVQNGRCYAYAIRARNTEGAGPVSDFFNVTPMGQPPAPILRARVSGTRVTLRWDMLQPNGTLSVTGFVLLRGTSMADMREIATIGIEDRYMDTDVEAGATYFYRLVPRTERGDGIASEYLSVEIPPAPDWSWLPMVIIVGVAVVVTTLVVVRNRDALLRRKEIVPSSAASAPVVAEVPVDTAPRYIVEEVFVVHRNGRLIASCSREGCRTDDADLLTGMLVAVQGIVQDGLQSGGELESVKYGESEILLASGSYVSVAVTVHGTPDEPLSDAIETTVQMIEAAYAGVLEAWSGDPAVLSGVEEHLLPLIRRTEAVPWASVRAVPTAPGVSLVSAVDFHRGYVRLKVLVVNATRELVADASMQVEYAPDMLRLERVEPSTLRLRGDRVALGNIKPGERTTAFFLFDPQICQGTHIDGLLTYFDGEGVRQRVEMKRRHVEVVCPIFFTKQHANTGMLRRLVKERLHMGDTRAFRYPQALSPPDVLALGKLAIGGSGIQLVREYGVEGPPFEAEVWYYGETKVKGHQMVMRLSVLEERQVVELYASSEAMGPVTGLLAEFRREFERALKERLGDGVRLDLSVDDSLRRELGSREPLMERMGDPADDEGVAR